jgi:hypothetical protein
VGEAMTMFAAILGFTALMGILLTVWALWGLFMFAKAVIFNKEPVRYRDDK